MTERQRGKSSGLGKVLRVSEADDLGRAATAELQAILESVIAASQSSTKPPFGPFVLLWTFTVAVIRLTILLLLVAGVGIVVLAVNLVRLALRLTSGSKSVPENAPSLAITGSTAIILLADIAGSTALTERIGDDAYRDKERELDSALRAAIQETGGQAIVGKVLGDGVMATFASAREAIDCALRCRTAAEAEGLTLHLGMHAGDVAWEGSNVHGGAVQIAARIADASEPGEVLVSQTVRDLARTSADVSFEDRGERELKGVAEPVRLYEVRWRETD